jgi:hypothetical protein
MVDALQIGPTAVAGADNTTANLRGGRTGEAIVQNLHGSYYEQNYRGNLFSNGSTTTALSANTISLTATTTPILGVWNPPGSGKNLVLLHASLCVAVAGSSAVANGGFVWASSVGNVAISTGSAPFNRSTLAASGSVAKGLSFIALTGLTNNLAINHGAAFGGLIMAQGATGTPMLGAPAMEFFEGAVFVPPGGVWALLNTVSTTTVSVHGMLMWEEVPITG